MEFPEDRKVITIVLNGNVPIRATKSLKNRHHNALSGAIACSKPIPLAGVAPAARL